MCVHNIPHRVGTTTKYTYDRIADIEYRLYKYALKADEAERLRKKANNTDRLREEVDGLRAENEWLKKKLGLNPGKGSISVHGQSAVLRVPRAASSSNAVASSSGVIKSIFKKERK